MQTRVRVRCPVPGEPRYRLGGAESPVMARSLLPKSRPRLDAEGGIVRRVLLAADACGLTLAFIFTEVLFGSLGSADPGQQLSLGVELGLFVLTVPVWILLAKVYGLYERDEERPAHTTVDDLVRVFHLVTVGVWAIALASWLTGLVKPEFSKLAFFWAVAIALIVLARSVARVFVRRTAAYRQTTLIVGGRRCGAACFREAQKTRRPRP